MPVCDIFSSKQVGQADQRHGGSPKDSYDASFRLFASCARCVVNLAVNGGLVVAPKRRLLELADWSACWDEADAP